MEILLPEGARLRFWVETGDSSVVFSHGLVTRNLVTHISVSIHYVYDIILLIGQKRYHFGFVFVQNNAI